MDFVYNIAAKAKFVTDGLRDFFEYRDLGIKNATDRKFHAHVIRAVPGKHAVSEWHTHTLDFQMVYILKGWATFEYEGQCQRTLRPGDCILQPPGIRHREIEHSDDLELVEITSPGDFATQLTDAPSQAAE